MIESNDQDWGLCDHGPVVQDLDDYDDVEAPVVDLPARPVLSGNYHRPPRELSTYVDDFVATVLGDLE